MRPFKSVQTPKIGRSVFDLSHTKLFDADMGYLYPVMADLVVPGDSLKIGNEIVVRCMPLTTPMLHEVNIYTHYYFIPLRILWDSWEDFISGGVDGDDASTLPRMKYPDIGTNPGQIPWEKSLWNYLGFPYVAGGIASNQHSRPTDFARRAYLKIWNDYYRDETLQEEIDITADLSDKATLLRRAWSKDYFTSALPWAQRGTAPALPISGTAPISGTVVDAPVTFDFSKLPSNGSARPTGFRADISEAPYLTYVGLGDEATPTGKWNTADFTSVNGGSLDGDADLSGATTFDVNDLRLAFQIQKWMERNARTGVRYTEFLHGHFGVSPRDERLQRPEYIGGSKAPLIVSEVLQTSESNTTPQGNMAGHGISVDRTFAGKYYATEYGIVMGIMSIMPVPMYCQGLNRQWLQQTKYDFYFPEFSTLGEQMITMGELYLTSTDANNDKEFGFQGRYDEYRYKPNQVMGRLSPNGGEIGYQEWTLCRSFGSEPGLNAAFIECNPTPRAWAVTTDAPQFVVHFGNKIKAVRPIPAMGTPGLIDHH